MLKYVKGVSLKTGHTLVLSFTKLQSCCFTVSWTPICCPAHLGLGDL